MKAFRDCLRPRLVVGPNSGSGTQGLRPAFESGATVACLNLFALSAPEFFAFLGFFIYFTLQA